MFKSEEPVAIVTIAETAKEPAKVNSAGDIMFGSRPMFAGAGGMPKFKALNKKAMDKEEFPDLGGVLTKKEKKTANTTTVTSSKPEVKAVNAPKFTGGHTRFDGFKGMEKDTKTKDDDDRDSSEDKPMYRRTDDREPREHREEREPREYRESREDKEENEFFSNFRSTNKEIKAKEPEFVKETGKTSTSYH